MLTILVACREAISIADLFRLLPAFSIEQPPATPTDLWMAVGSSHILELCSIEESNDLRKCRIKLRNAPLREAVQSGYIGQDLSAAHRLLVGQMDALRHPYDRRNVLFHALQGFDNSPSMLTAFIETLDWRQLLREGLKEDWSSTDNLLLLDLTRVLGQIPFRARSVVTRIARKQLDSRTLATTDRLRLDELLSVARVRWQPNSKRTSLHIALDDWPGYFPLFAMEKELNEYGINFILVESSEMKFRLLMERHVDLIASTTGCVSTLSSAALRNCCVLGALNRSMGNDQILADDRAFDALNAFEESACLGTKRHTALVVRGTTSHLFLLWFSWALAPNRPARDVDFEDWKARLQNLAKGPGTRNLHVQRQRSRLAPSLNGSGPSEDFQFDVFVSHASEDTAYVVPLVTELKAAGIRVWFDQNILGWGDDLRESIDCGLTNCRYGIVVFSKAFLRKSKWTEYEVNALFAREQAGGKLLLPIWHGITRDDLLSYCPAFADRLAKSLSAESYAEIVATLLALLRQ